MTPAAGRAAWGGLGLSVLLLAGCASLPPVGARLPPVTGAPDTPARAEVYRSHREDTLISLARDHDLGYVEMVAANPGVDPWLPGDDTPVVLPTVHLPPPGPREGIVVNLGEQRLYWFGERGETLSFPIGVGRPGWKTPLGTSRVVRKQRNPVWMPPKSARTEDPTLPAVVRPGPDNPLGTHALYLGWPRYLIHGTNEPYGVGRRVSRGCIRLYPEDITQLYARTPIGTPVRVIDEPVKIGWLGNELFLEVHPTLAQAWEIEEAGSFAPHAPDGVPELVIEHARDAGHRLDWDAVEAAARARNGFPVRITRPESPPPGWLRSLVARVLPR